MSIWGNILTPLAEKCAATAVTGLPSSDQICMFRMVFMIFRATVSAICLLVLAVSSLAQVRGENAVARPVRVDEPPKIDGILDESLWEDIEPITDFRQYEPVNGEPATERTEVRICYDDRFLYFGIRAFDSEPDKIIARTFERDSNVDNDDSFTIAIDSLNDNRTAVAFDTNVLGTKLDVQYNEGGAFNLNWDSIWYAKGNIDELGYTLEVAIPFFALRFKPTSEVEMGLNLERIIRRKNEKVNWPYLPLDYEFTYVSQYGRMVGLEGIARGVNLEIKPYGLAGYSERELVSDYDLDAGLDVKWGVTSNLTSDLTLNPDFAQVESDDLQINLTRFSLFYPEKRDFFIESSDLFQFGIPQSAEVFFSRRIGIRDGREVPIYGGARAYGMVGRTNIGLMTMQTRSSDGIESENFSVARVKHNILNRSYVGGIVTSRKGETELEDTTLGADAMFLFWKNIKINGSLARSDRPGIDDGNWMGNLSVRQNIDILDWVVSYDDIGERFHPGIGFIARPDQRSFYSNIHYNPRPGWKGVRQLTFGHLYRHIENHGGVLETQTFRPGFMATFQTEDWFMSLYEDTYEFVPQAFSIAPDVVIPVGEYKNRQLSLHFYTNTARRISLGSVYKTGSFYDGTRRSVSLELVFKPMPQLHLRTEQVFDRVDVPSGAFDSLISRLDVSYFFSPSLTTRIAAQYSSLLEDFILNMRLRWIYTPGSEIWLVYDEGRRFDTIFPSLRARAFIFKVVHNFHF